jgi:outer membrane protein assembly factor BamB
VLGCTAGAYAVSPSALYTADLPSGTIQTVGSTSIEMFDIALAPSGILYGVDGVSNLYVLDATTASARMIAPLGLTVNGLEAAPDGTLYGAGISGELYAVDPTTGKLTPLVPYPPGYGPSGDLASVEGTLFGTAAGPAVNDDVLVAFDLATRNATIVGSTGFSCIYGLAAHGASLFGFTCIGQILSLDTATGRGTLLATPGPTFYGASAR